MALHPDVPSGTYVCPVDLEHDARLVLDPYSGRLVRRRDGGWALVGSVNLGADGKIVGSISDPVPFELPTRDSGPASSAVQDTPVHDRTTRHRLGVMSRH